MLNLLNLYTTTTATNPFPYLFDGLWSSTTSDYTIINIIGIAALVGVIIFSIGHIILEPIMIAIGTIATVLGLAGLAIIGSISETNLPKELQTWSETTYGVEITYTEAEALLNQASIQLHNGQTIILTQIENEGQILTTVENKELPINVKN